MVTLQWKHIRTGIMQTRTYDSIDQALTQVRFLRNIKSDIKISMDGEAI